VNDDSGATPVVVDQRLNGGEWHLLGTYSFTQGGQYGISLSDAADGYVIADAVKLVPVNAAPNTASWRFIPTESKQYHIYARWTAGANRATNANYIVSHDGGDTPTSMNQQANGGSWNLLGTYSFTQGNEYLVRLTDQADGFMIADAIKVVPIDAPPNSASWLFVANQTGQHQVYAHWTAHPNRASNASYTVQHAAGSTPVVVNQQTDSATWNLLGTFDFIQGETYSVTLTDQADGYVIADAITVLPPDARPNSFSWKLPIATTGQYEVYARWTSHANRASNARFTVQHDGGETLHTLNQQTNGAKWILLGTYSFTQNGQYSVILTDQADGYVIADSIRLVLVP